MTQPDNITTSSDDDGPILPPGSDGVYFPPLFKRTPAEWDGIFAALANAKPWGRPQRHPRRPPLARLIAEAEKAGRQVTSITRDGVTYTFSADAAAAESNPFELEAQRLRRR